MMIALQAQGNFARLLSGSLVLTFFVYIFVNMGMVSGLLPVVGVPLPLISYGGTSIVTLMAAFGLLMGVHTHKRSVIGLVFILIIFAWEFQCMNRRYFLPLLLSLLTGLLSSSVVHAVQVVNYGVQPATMPIYIAKAIGLLEEIEKKHNVKIELRSFSYGAPENQAMAAGQLQIASAGMGPAMVAATRLPAKLIGISILEQTAIIIPIDSTVAKCGRFER
jgi:hypothetical protein